MRVERYRALDGWRGVAALCVALFHAPFRSSFAQIAFVNHAGFLVDFFFVLSGFVLTHSLKPGETFTSFFLRRTGRLWPLHTFLLVLLILLEMVKLALDRHGIRSDDAPFTNSHSIASIFSNLLLVHSLGLHDTLTWNVPSWSISVEMWVSMLLIIIALMGRSRTGLIAWALALGSGMLLFCVSPSPAEETYRWGFFRCSYAFFLGVALYTFFRQPAPRTGARWEWPLLLGTVIFVSAFRSGPWSLLAAPLFAIFVYVFAAEGGTISSWLKHPLAGWMGERSYSIYMTHGVIGDILWRIAKFIGRETGLPLNETISQMPRINYGGIGWMNAGVCLYLGLVLGCSALTYRWLEVPCRRWFYKVAEKYRGKAPGAIISSETEPLAKPVDG